MDAAEEAREVERVGKSQLFGDLADRQARTIQQLAGAAELQPDEIVQGREAGELLEDGAEMRGREVDHARLSRR